MHPSVTEQSVVTELLLEVCSHRVRQVVTCDDLKQCGMSREQFTERIAEILLRNLASGRAQRVIAAEEWRSRGGTRAFSSAPSVP